jgi:hypothetical protein
VHGRAEPLLFTFLTDRATQVQFLEFDYFTEKNQSKISTADWLPEVIFCTIPDANWKS